MENPFSRRWSAIAMTFPIPQRKQLLVLAALLWVQSAAANDFGARSAIAAPPDSETERLIRQRYSVYLASGRGCSYFANPKTLDKNRLPNSPDDRRITVLNAPRSNDEDGKLCRGVFRFLWLTVNCRTKVITFRDSAPSLEEQERQKITYVDESVSSKVCAL
ncbi:MAG TPA: hypothetical protein V6D18_12715 [Thermosynechococcaceae cyanobacterium]